MPQARKKTYDASFGAGGWDKNDRSEVMLAGTQNDQHTDGAVKQRQVLDARLDVSCLLHVLGHL